MNGKLSRRFIMQAIETMCSIGIHDFEKQAPQRILVDLEVLLDPEAEPRADHIDDALNYDQIRDAVVQIAQSRHFDLQNTRSEIFLITCLKCIQLSDCLSKPLSQMSIKMLAVQAINYQI